MRTAAGAAMKALQLAVSVAFLAILWQIYPGVAAGMIGLGHIAASAAAMFGSRVATLVALAFTTLAGAFASWGVYRYLDNGFRYLSGNFDGRTGIHWPAYLFLFAATGAITVIVLHVLIWRSATARTAPGG
jgi:hypothetical protein